MRRLSPMKISELFTLQYDYWSSKPELARNGGVPYPDTNYAAYITDPEKPATVALYEATLRYYPLKLSQIVLGDGLRAYFECHMPRPALKVDVRYTRSEIYKEQKRLLCDRDDRVGEFSIIPAWNLAQLTVAVHLMDLIPDPNRTGVPLAVTDGFLGTPHQFEQALKNWGVHKI